MKRLVSEILVTTSDKTYVFDTVASCSIKSSWENLTDTCTITFPRTLRLRDQTIIANQLGGEKVFDIGNEIEVKLGYYPNLTTRFKGYITRVSPDANLTFYCQDEAWNLKKVNVKKSYKDITLKNLVADWMSSVTIPFVVSDGITFTGFRITRNPTVASALNQLKQKYNGIYAFFREGVLYVGSPFSSFSRNVPRSVFNFQHNIVSNDLQYRVKENYEIGVKGVSKLSDNSTIEAFAGVDTGDIRTINFLSKSQAELQKLCEDALTKYNYTGYNGKFRTFLEPEIKHGEVIDLVDGVLKDRNSSYRVQGVETTFGTGGGWQDINLNLVVETDNEVE